MKTFQDRLIWARKKAGVSQKDVADFIGTAQPSYSELESGKTQRSKYTAEIAHFLSVNAYWLATGKGEPEPVLPEELVDLINHATKEDIAAIRHIIKKFSELNK